MSKGSRQRPLSVPKEKFKQNWDMIFGKKKPAEKEKDDNNRTTSGNRRGD
jgi:hypothetical protein